MNSFINDVKIVQQTGKLQFLILYSTKEGEITTDKDILAPIVEEIKANLPDNGTILAYPIETYLKPPINHLKKLQERFGYNTILIIFMHGSNCIDVSIKKMVEEKYQIFFPKITLFVSCQGARYCQKKLRNQMSLVKFMDSVRESEPQTLISPYPSICFGELYFGFTSNTEKKNNEEYVWKIDTIDYLSRFEGIFVEEADIKVNNNSDYYFQKYIADEVIRRWNIIFPYSGPKMFSIDLLTTENKNSCTRRDTLDYNQRKILYQFEQYKGSELKLGFNISNNVLNPGEFIYDNGLLLVYQKDGNLVLYNVAEDNTVETLWASETNTYYPTQTSIDENCNIRVGTKEVINTKDLFKVEMADNWFIKLYNHEFIIGYTTVTQSFIVNSSSQIKIGNRYSVVSNLEQIITEQGWTAKF